MMLRSLPCCSAMRTTARMRLQLRRRHLQVQMERKEAQLASSAASQAPPLLLLPCLLIRIRICRVLIVTLLVVLPRG